MSSPTPSRIWQWVRTVCPTLLALALLATAATWFFQRWQAVVATAPSAPIAWGWIVLGILLLVLHATSALVIWRQALAATRATLPWGIALDVFVPTWLARYVPGRVWASAARLALSKRVGVAYGQATGAMAWEAGLALATACLVALISLGGSLDARTAQVLRLLVGFGALLVLALVLLRRLPTGILPAGGVALLGWLLFGAAHLAVARSVAPVTMVDLPLVTGAMALAWSAGFIALVVPLGIGVRDALLLVLLTPLLEPSAALRFVALARLAQLVADVGLTLLWLILRRLRPSPTPSGAPGTPGPQVAAG